LALISLTIELKAAVGVEVSWTVNGSGVGLVVWADTAASEPPKATGTMMAHKNQKTCFTDSSEITIKTQIRAD
jgi:hypothetical protein